MGKSKIMDNSWSMNKSRLLDKIWNRGRISTVNRSKCSDTEQEYEYQWEYDYNRVVGSNIVYGRVEGWRREWLGAFMVSKLYREGKYTTIQFVAHHYPSIKGRGCIFHYSWISLICHTLAMTYLYSCECYAKKNLVNWYKDSKSKSDFFIQRYSTMIFRRLFITKNFNIH